MSNFVYLDEYICKVTNLNRHDRPSDRERQNICGEPCWETPFSEESARRECSAPHPRRYADKLS